MRIAISCSKEHSLQLKENFYGPVGWCPGRLRRMGVGVLSSMKLSLYREELELERERWRLRPGDLERERLCTGGRLLGDRDRLLMRGGVRRHIGGGGGILRGGEGLRGGGRGLGASTADAVISCPSIWPPSMCSRAFWASSGVSNST